MKKFIISLAGLICCSLSLSAQDYHVPFRKGRWWGYADLKGNIIVEPKYDSVSPYGNNKRWFVFRGNKMGVLNGNNYEILKTEYDNIISSPVHSEYNDFYIVKNGKAGFTDMWGRVVLEPEYDSIEVAWNLPDTNYTFFVKNGGEWQVMNAKKNMYLQHIEKFSDEYDGTFLFKSKGKWGIFDAAKKRAWLNNEYDTIGRLDGYKESYYPKPEYEGYKFFAKKGKQVLLTNRKQQTVTLAIPFDNIFTQEKSGEVLREFSKVDIEEERHFKNILDFKTGDRPLYDGSLKLVYDGMDIRAMYLKKQNGKLGLAMVIGQSTKSIPAEYDSIKMIAYSEGYTNERYILVCKENKWGIYETFSDSLVVPARYKQILFSGKEELLLLIGGKSLSAFRLARSYSEMPSAVMYPFYDNIIDSKYINSDDLSRPSFMLYYGEHNGVVYPVGSNGVNYYAE